MHVAIGIILYYPALLAVYLVLRAFYDRLLPPITTLEATCKICLGDVTCLQVDTCKHTFCMSCLVEYAVTYQQNTFPLPCAEYKCTSTISWASFKAFISCPQSRALHGEYKERALEVELRRRVEKGKKKEGKQQLEKELLGWGHEWGWSCCPGCLNLVERSYGGDSPLE
jgi:hypothetical protein